MYKKIITQASFNDIITLSEAKAQCRLTNSFTMDDELISSLILSCCDLAQSYINRLLTVGTVMATIERHKSKVFLYGGDVSGIDSITATNSAGDEEVIAFASVNPISQYLSISSLYSSCTDFMITYQCGYETVPLKVKQGILMMIASMYNNKEDGLVGQTYQSIPMRSLVLLDSVKQY